MRFVLVRKLTRWGYRVVAVAAIVTVAGYVALQVGARYALRTLASRAGVPGLTYHFSSITPTSLTLTNLALPKGPTLGTVHATFSPRELLSGRLRTVTLSGLTATLDLTTSPPALEGLPAFTSSDSSSGSASPAAGTPLPSVLLSASTLNLKLPSGQTLSLPLEAKYANNQLHASVVIASDRINLVATHASNDTWALVANGSISSANLLPLLPARSLPEGLTLVGHPSFTAAYNTGSKAASAKIDLSDATARFRTAADTFDLANLSLELSARYDGTVAGTATLAGSVSSQWLGDGNKLLVTTDLSDRTAKGAFYLQGPQVTVTLPLYTVSLDRQNKPSGHAEVSAILRLPDRVLSQIRDAGIFIQNPEPLVAKGALSYTPETGAVADLHDVVTAASRITVGQSSLKDLRLNVANLSLSANSAGTSVTLTAPTLTTTAITLPQLGTLTPVSPATLSATAMSFTRGDSWQFGSPHITFNLPPTAASYNGTTLTNLTTTLHATASSEPGETTISLLPDSFVSLASAKDAGGRWSVDKTTIALSPRNKPTTRTTLTTQGTLSVTTVPSTGPAPLLPLLALREGQPPRISVTAESKDLSGSAESLQMKMGSIRASLEVALAEKTMVDGYFSLQHTDLTIPSTDTTLHDLSIRLPISLDSAVPLSGTFATTSVTAKGTTLPPITGTLYLTRKDAWAGFEWPLVKEGLVKSQVHAYFYNDKTALDMQAWIPEFEFRTSDAIRQLLPAAVADAEVTGRFPAQIRYYFDGERTVKWGEIEVKDASFKSKSIDAELTGINGKVWTRSFSPLETAPGQTLSVAAARMGAYPPVREGKINFRLDPGPSPTAPIVFVESANFNFAGGEVSAKGFRVDPFTQSTDLTLYADKLQVKELAKLASDSRVTGTGQLFARLPVSINLTKNTLSLGNGYIYAEGGDNMLSLGGNSKDVGRLLGAGSDNNPNLVQQRITAALIQFKYRSLSLDLVRDPATQILNAKLHFAGAGDERSDNQQLDFTFNFSGLEDLAREYLIIKRGQ